MLDADIGSEIAVILTKLNTVIDRLDRINGNVKSDHDRIIVLENQISRVENSTKTNAVDHDLLIKIAERIEDFMILKRSALGYAVGLIITLLLALYAVLQHGGIGSP